MSDNTKYIDKAKAEAQGFVRTSAGVVKLTAIEQLFYKGRLSYGNKRYCEEDRLRAANKLSSDYEKSHFNTICSFWKNDKVDQQSGRASPSVEYFRSRYLTAVKSIPQEFWSAVRQVCIENILPQPPVDVPTRRRTELKYLFCWDLCRGLDRLIDHYTAFKIKF